MHDDFIGTMPVQERHRFDTERLSAYLRAQVPGYGVLNLALTSTRLVTQVGDRQVRQPINPETPVWRSDD